VADANDLLIVFLENGDEGSDAALELLWQGEALTETRTFANQTRLRYQTPLTVTYTVIETPTVTALSDNTASVQTREFWVYEGPNAKRESLGDYNYTLQETGSVWQVVSYTFRALPIPAELSTLTITTTDTISPAETSP
jgi:hypothetical protein